MPIKIQKSKNGGYKNYSIAYFVFEKDAPCADYPPDEVTTFYDIQIQWDGVNYPAVWTTAFVDDVRAAFPLSHVTLLLLFLAFLILHVTPLAHNWF